MIKTVNHYEHMLLIEWAFWVKSEFYMWSYVQGPLAAKRWSPNPLNDDVMVEVDRVVAGLPKQEKSVIKAFYLSREYNNERELDLALDDFSHAYQRVPEKLRPELDLLESRAQLFIRHES